jgi:hypothetical protein
LSGDRETQFDDDEFASAYPDGIENHYWNRARNRVIADYVARYDLNDIVDVGCGRGIVASFLHARGIRVTGIEKGRARPMPGNGAPIRFETDATAVSAEQAAGVKTLALFDVIEHLEHPTPFLKALARAFPDADRLIVTVPARAELWTNFDDHYGHFRRYTLPQLRAEMEAAGFRLVTQRYFFHTLYALIRVSNLFFKQRREIKVVPPTGAGAAAHALLAALLRWERLLVPGRVVGSSIICVARRSS